MSARMQTSPEIALADGSLLSVRLWALQDAKYREFQCRLMPNVNPDTVIGVRTPQLRALSRELAHCAQAEQFLQTLPHGFYEENNLHVFLLNRIKDFDEVVQAVDAFLPYVDNWATCDSLSPAAFGREKGRLAEKIPQWLDSGAEYTVRFGLKTVMNRFLDADCFSHELLALSASVRSEYYYIRMMQAWLFATALAKQYDAALPYLTQRRLNDWTHNKTIQKAVESFRITDAQKQYLRTLRIKDNGLPAGV